MPNYIPEASNKFNHNKPAKPEHAPHMWNKQVYGKKIQTAIENDVSKKLDKKQVR